MEAIHDLNLLHALDALLQEGSVTAAARRAGMTTPAMSRALGRLRDNLGDPLFVRAGRQLVATPYALTLRDRVAAARREAQALLGPASHAAVADLTGTLVVRCSDAVASMLCGPLDARRAKQAPGLSFRFVEEGDEDAAALREGRVDLDIGVLSYEEPEVKTRGLFSDAFVAVVRRGHPALRRRGPQALASHGHIAVSRTGKARGPLDFALAKVGLSRAVVAVVPSFYPALLTAATSDLIATVPGSLARHAGALLPIATMALPATLPTLAIAMAWHPRTDGEPARRWLREAVVAVARSVAPAGRRVSAR